MANIPERTCIACRKKGSKDNFIKVVKNKNNELQIEKDKKLYLISRSNNPYLNITNVNGGFIDINNSKVLNNYYKKQNKWSLGVSMGVYGIYGLSNKKFDFGPGVGLSLNYHFCSW